MTLARLSSRSGGPNRSLFGGTGVGRICRSHVFDVNTAAMSPPDPENDPVHKGLHQLGQQIGGRSASPPPSEDVDPADNPVEKGLHELGRQIDEANRSGGRRGKKTDGDPQRQGPAHAARKKRSRKRTAAWIGGTVALVVVLIAGAAAGYGWYLNHEIHHIDLHNLTSAPVKGDDAGTENILMIGSTDRCALKVQNPAYGLCSQGVNGVNSDVVMILHLNPVNHSLSILSIPRDLFVPNARSGNNANKIDAALYQGPDQLIAAIEDDLGISIQHFVELNFDSFINVVQALGGIKMYFPEPVYDAYSGLNIQTTGCLSLNGTQALQVVRARHVQYKGPGVTRTNPAYWPQEAQSDIARIRRDHEFLRVLGAAVKAKGLSNPITDQQLVSGVVGQLTVDNGFSASDMISLVLGYHDVDVGSAPQLTVPVSVDQFGNYVYQGGSYGDIEFPAEPQDHNAVDQFLGLKSANEDTYSGGVAPLAVIGDGLRAQRLRRLQPGDHDVAEPPGARASRSGPSATARRSAARPRRSSTTPPRRRPSWRRRRPWPTPCRAPSSWPSTRRR